MRQSQPHPAQLAEARRIGLQGGAIESPRVVLEEVAPWEIFGLVVGVGVVLARALPADAVRLCEGQPRALPAAERTTRAGRATGREELLAGPELEGEVALQTAAAVLAACAVHTVPTRHHREVVTHGCSGARRHSTAVGAAGSADDGCSCGRCRCKCGR